MTRNSRSPRSVFGNKGKFGRLLPVHMSLLAPGETLLSHKAQIDMSSLPTTFANAGATFDVWSYIVPLRLVWDKFPDFLMGDATADIGPHVLGDGTLEDDRFPASRHCSFGMKAYELIVNEFFRTDEDGAFTYAKASDLAALPTVDMTGELMGSQAYDEDDIVIDVTGGLSLNELARKKAEHHYDRSIDALDGKYLSYLQRNGVRKTEQLSMYPEFIGHGRKYVKPRKTVSQSTGFTVQHYALDFDFRLNKKRYINEHSLLVTVCSVRPKVHIDTNVSYFYIMINPENWPHKGQLEDHRDFDAQGRDGAGDLNGNSSLDDMLFVGDAQVNGDMGANTVCVHNPASVAAAKFPTTQWDSFVSDATPLGGDHFTIEGICSQRIATPLSRKKVA